MVVFSLDGDTVGSVTFSSLFYAGNLIEKSPVFRQGNQRLVDSCASAGGMCGADPARRDRAAALDADINVRVSLRATYLALFLVFPGLPASFWCS